MQEILVQIERLQALRVATVAIAGESPEAQAINRLLEWARPRGLLDRAVRLFGYDNCQPYPNHTYTAWLTVAAATEPAADIAIMDFAGGLFAVTEVVGVEGITPGWRQLAEWARLNGYATRDQPGLEELSDVLADRAPDDWRIRLYLPIAG
jgi:DNA gyrase inhibitor GyrI